LGAPALPGGHNLVAAGGAGATWANVARQVAFVIPFNDAGFSCGGRGCYFLPPIGRAERRAEERFGHAGVVSGRELSPGPLRVVTRGHPLPISL
jgi:hypothetical protein